jgi:hypothetical protein
MLLPGQGIRDPSDCFGALARTTFIFVDAGGLKFRQRFTLRMGPEAVPVVAKPPAAQLENIPAKTSSS